MDIEDIGLLGIDVGFRNPDTQWVLLGAGAESLGWQNLTRTVSAAAVTSLVQHILSDCNRQIACPSQCRWQLGSVVRTPVH